MPKLILANDNMTKSKNLSDAELTKIINSYFIIYSLFTFLACRAVIWPGVMLNLYDQFMTRDSDEQQYVSHLVKYSAQVLEVLVGSRKHRIDIMNYSSLH